ncbi:hypothetical protein ABZS29_16875 [Kribbella sp. NPDC005582]|uniref:hypothetical protein n=1 Tax=Kribbella sp. NPDC005582 TaxID=3156893 RepID=UPI0033A8987E
MPKSLLTTTTLLSLALVAPIVVAGCNNDDKPSAAGSTAPTTPSVSTPSASTPAKVGAEVTLFPVVKGRVLTMKVTVAGTAVVPLGGDDRKPLPEDTSFVDLGLGAEYTYGDGSEPGGSDGGSVTCEGATKQKTGTQTYEPAAPHTYAKPGTYTFTYKISYCGGPAGRFTATKTAQIVVA